MCENCGCKTEAMSEISIADLLKKQKEDKQIVFLPVLKEIVGGLISGGIKVEIDNDEFAAIKLSCKDWEASLDLITFYEKEKIEMKPKTYIALDEKGLRIVQEDDLDYMRDRDDEDRQDLEDSICSSCLLDDDPVEMTVTDNTRDWVDINIKKKTKKPIKKVVKDTKQKKEIKRKSNKK